MYWKNKYGSIIKDDNQYNLVLENLKRKQKFSMEKLEQAGETLEELNGQILEILGQRSAYLKELQEQEAINQKIV